MAVFIVFKVICCTITILSNLISCLLCKVTACLIELAIKVLKLPGAALQSALEQIGGVIRCCLENLMMSVLKSALNAIQKVVDFFFNLVVEIVSKLVAGAMERAGQGLVNKIESVLLEVISGFLEIFMKTMTTSMRLFYNLVVDVISRSTGELVEKMMSILLELIKLIVSSLEILLHVSDNVASFSNLVLEGVPGWLASAGELIDQITSSWDELTELMKSAVETGRALVERLSPVIVELIKRIVGLLYEHVVDFVVDHVKQLVFGFVFGSVVMSEYHHMIERVLESVVRSVVENFTTMVMYFFSRNIESIQITRGNNT